MGLSARNGSSTGRITDSGCAGSWWTVSSSRAEEATVCCSTCCIRGESELSWSCHLRSAVASQRPCWEWQSTRLPCRSRNVEPSSGSDSGRFSMVSSTDPWSSGTSSQTSRRFARSVLTAHSVSCHSFIVLTDLTQGPSWDRRSVPEA